MGLRHSRDIRYQAPLPSASRVTKKRRRSLHSAIAIDRDNMIEMLAVERHRDVRVRKRAMTQRSEWLSHSRYTTLR